VSLYTLWYNFARINSAVRIARDGCRLTERLWDVGDIVNLIEEWENKAAQSGLKEE